MRVKTKVKAGAAIQLGGQNVEVDEDGFLQDPVEWSEEVAKL